MFSLLSQVLSRMAEHGMPEPEQDSTRDGGVMLTIKAWN